MRFGKTFASYQLARKMGLKRVLVLTFKPAVESAWREDLISHVDFEGWQFVSNKDAHNNNVNMDQRTLPPIFLGAISHHICVTVAQAPSNCNTP